MSAGGHHTGRAYFVLRTALACLSSSVLLIIIITAVTAAAAAAAAAVPQRQSKEDVIFVQGEYETFSA